MGISAQLFPEKTAMWSVFNRIAPRYDFLNRLLSFGIDKGWRRQVVRCLPDREGLRVLDVATGTADLLLACLKSSKSSHIQQITGVDMAEDMLAIGRQKCMKQGYADKALLSKADATALPFEDNTFDVAMIAFGIRNVDNLDKALSELKRVINPDGTVFILEFSMPRLWLVRVFYLFYFRTLLPIIGGLVSGDFKAYKYLNQSVEAFPYGTAFCDRMRALSYTSVKATSLTFGIASLYQGRK